MAKKVAVCPETLAINVPASLSLEMLQWAKKVPLVRSIYFPCVLLILQQLNQNPDGDRSSFSIYNEKSVNIDTPVAKAFLFSKFSYLLHIL